MSPSTLLPNRSTLLLSGCLVLAGVLPAHAQTATEAARWSESDPLHAVRSGPAAPAAYRDSFFGGSVSVQARPLLGEPAAFADGPAEAEAPATAPVRRWRGAELRVRTTVVPRHLLALELQALSDTPPAGVDDDTPLPGAAPAAPVATRFGLNAQDEWRIAPTLSATAGLEVERAGGADSRNSSHAALVWQATSATIVRTVFSRSRRDAGASTSAAGGTAPLGNPRLVADRFDGLELSAQHRIEAGWRLRASAYQRWLQGPVAFDTESATPLVPHQPDGPLLAQGVELSTDVSWAWGGRVSGSLSLQQASGTDKARIPDLPGVLGRLSLSAPLPVAGWQMGYDLRYAGDPGAAEGEPPADHAVSALWLRSGRLPGGVELGLSVHNLFDRRIATSEGDGAALAVGLSDGRSVALDVRWPF